MAVAIRLSGGANVHRPSKPGSSKASSSRDSSSAGGGRGCARVGTDEARDLSHFQAFICHASYRERVRHPNGSGVVGTLGCADDNDLHARTQGWWTGCAKPDRCVFAVKEAKECYAAILAAYHRALL